MMGKTWGYMSHIIILGLGIQYINKGKIKH